MRAPLNVKDRETCEGLAWEDCGLCIKAVYKGQVMSTSVGNLIPVRL